MPKLITELDEQTLQALQQRAQQNKRTVEEEVAAILRQLALPRYDAHQLLAQYLLAQGKPCALNFTYNGFKFDAVYLSKSGEPYALIEATDARNLWSKAQDVEARAINLPLLIVVSASQPHTDAVTLLDMAQFQRYPAISAVGLLMEPAEAMITLLSMLPLSEARVRAQETLHRLIQMGATPEVVWMEILQNPYALHAWHKTLWGKADAVYAWNEQASQFQLVYDSVTRLLRREIARLLRKTVPAPPPPTPEQRQQIESLLQSVHQHTVHLPPEESEADITAAFEEYQRGCG